MSDAMIILGSMVLGASVLGLVGLFMWAGERNKLPKAKDIVWLALGLMAFVFVIIPVYVLTRINDGIAAFMDAALPELSGLVYRVRATARAQAEHRLAAWNKSVAYDRDDHRRKMAEFDDSDADDGSNADEEWLGGAANVEGDYLRY